MFRWLNLLLLLLLCFVNNSGNNTKHVTGKKGDNVILSCEFEASQILLVELIRESDELDVCQDQKNCSHQVFREGSCDVIMKNLSFRDAGKYTLRVHYKNDQENVAKNEDKMYQLQILGNISVNTGESLNLTFLLANADKVEKNSSEGWKEIHGVNLTIKEFTAVNAGTYRVLDSNNEILITVTVTEFTTQSMGHQKDKYGPINSTEQPTVEPWVVCLGIPAFVILIVILIILILIIVILIVVICKRRRRDPLRVQQGDQEDQEGPMMVLTERD